MRLERDAILLRESWGFEHVQRYTVAKKVLPFVCVCVTDIYVVKKMATREFGRLWEGYRMDGDIPAPSKNTKQILAANVCIHLTIISNTIKI
jgi:hypothetical protein